MQQMLEALQPHLGWAKRSNLRRVLIITTLLLLLAMLAACGRTRQPQGLPTEIPTLAPVQPPTATPLPTDTPAPTATREPSSSAVVTTTTTVTTSTETTATAPLTTTATVSSTPTLTATTPLTTTEAVSGTPAVTTTSAVTSAATVSETPGVTTTPEVTTTTPVTTAAPVTTTGAMTGMAPMTGTVPVTGTKSTTSTAAAPRVFFRQPTNGAIVPITTTVVMSATGLKVEPAGDVHEGAGHFHLLIDKDFTATGNAIPKDAQDLHFGKGQLTATITLTEGIHVLRLQFANGAHVALEGPEYRDTITVTAKAGAPAQAVRFVTPENGATVSETFEVGMAATGLIVEPAGTVRPDAGHFHILVDTDFVTTGNAIPKDAQELHYGKGELKTKLTLKPGKHTLRLQFANGAHIALEGPQYRDEITVTVQ